jgi:hypothetical protein
VATCHYLDGVSQLLNREVSAVTLVSPINRAADIDLLCY